MCINQSAGLKPYFQADTYILKGSGTEVYTPRFTYHGFRYVQVTGLPTIPTTNTLVAQVVHTAFNPTGSFPLFERFAQPHRDQYHLVVSGKLCGNSDGLPAPREERLDGRCANAGV